MSVQHEEHSELIEDICYLEHLISVEKQHIKARMLTRVGNAQSMDDKVDVLSDELSHTLATMSARIQLIEQSLSTAKQHQTVLKKVETHQGEEAKIKSIPSLATALKISVVDLAARNKLYPLKHASDGRPYVDFCPGDAVNFVLPLDRSAKKTLAVDIIGINSSEVHGLELWIDGHRLKHKVKKVNSIQRLICYLPKSTTGNKTYAELKYNTVKGSASLGLSDVNCVDKLSILAGVNTLFREKINGGA